MPDLFCCFRAREVLGVRHVVAEAKVGGYGTFVFKRFITVLAADSGPAVIVQAVGVKKIFDCIWEDVCPWSPAVFLWALALPLDEELAFR